MEEKKIELLNNDALDAVAGGTGKKSPIFNINQKVRITEETTHPKGTVGMIKFRYEENDGYYYDLYETQGNGNYLGKFRERILAAVMN